MLTISRQSRVNEEIRYSEIRVIDETGEMLGIMDSKKAQDMAYERNLDLVEVSPGAKPPVCKFMDYGKFKYESQKREKMAKKNQKTIQVKEIRLSTFIEEHDVTVKARRAEKFLKDGDKVKVSLRFRGRERDYTAKGRQVMNDFAEICKEFGDVEKKPKFEGRSLTMFLAPKANKNK